MEGFGVFQWESCRRYGLPRRNVKQYKKGLGSGELCALPASAVRQETVNVWDVRAEGSDEEMAGEGLARMEAYMKELGVVMRLRELGVTEAMIEGIADGTFILEGGYKVLSREEVVKILEESL